jgi:hypothetical protein
MKKIILSMAIAAIFASCSNNKPADQATTTPAVNSADTIGLSDYKEWKQKQELQGTQQTFTSPGVNDPGSVTEIAPPAEAKPQPKTVIIYRDAPARQPRVAKASRPSSHSVYKTPEAEPETPSVVKAPAPVSSGSKREPYGRGTTGTEGTAGSGTTPSNEGDGNGDVAVGTGTTPTPAQVPAKKDGGWSKAAKGGAIGGASGAVIGAILSKNKTKGAVIGGIVGAAGGYIFGRSKDKKDTTKN